MSSRKNISEMAQRVTDLAMKRGQGGMKLNSAPIIIGELSIKVNQLAAIAAKKNHEKEKSNMILELFGIAATALRAAYELGRDRGEEQ